ncbi:MAG TPA: hypothetical protein VFX60_17795 [Micromonospora sp.]|nr:hypothetical protein [Micromonospora sp.]
MVLTDLVRTAEEDQGRGSGLPRRALLRAALAAAAAVPLASCDLSDDEPEPEPSPDPLAPLITGALDLAARHRAAAAAFPELAARLTSVAQAHEAHATELARSIGAAVPSEAVGSASPSDPPPGPQESDMKAALAALRAAEQEGRDAAAAACLVAPKEHAALVGSIAAARATHLEVLK